MQEEPYGVDRSPSTAIVAVVGLGKIGVPLAVQYAQHEYRVIGCDVNPEVVESINAGRSPVREEPELVTAVPRLVDAGKLSATVDTASAVHAATIVVVIVPVLINERHEVDFTQIESATAAIGEALQPGTLVIYETTLPVGTTAQRLGPLLEHISGLTAGRDFSLAYSPERVSSGSLFRDLRRYPKIVGGIDEASTADAVAFYRAALEAEVIVMASTQAAEFVKLIETTYRDVNIALANEFARYADAHGLDVAAAIAAANTQPYSHIHTPGVGVGGHCIPVYPYFLFANPADVSAEVSDDELQLPRLARRVNDSMARYAVQRMEALLGTLRGRSVLMLGVAYRGNVRETAWSSAKLLSEELVQRGARVYVDDPLFSESELRSLGYVPMRPGREAEIEVVLLQSNHDAYLELNFAHFPRCQLVLDGRRALSRVSIESLGIRYMAIGDGTSLSAGTLPLSPALTWQEGEGW